jgi:hypothetical protein
MSHLAFTYSESREDEPPRFRNRTLCGARDVAAPERVGPQLGGIEDPPPATDCSDCARALVAEQELWRKVSAAVPEGSGTGVWRAVRTAFASVALYGRRYGFNADEDSGHRTRATFHPKDTGGQIVTVFDSAPYVAVTP